MAASQYQSALELAESLPLEDRLRLVQELSAHMRANADQDRPRSVLELRGLGAEIWKQIDAQNYVHGERASWDG